MAILTLLPRRAVGMRNARAAISSTTQTFHKGGKLRSPVSAFASAPSAFATPKTSAKNRPYSTLGNCSPLSLHSDNSQYWRGNSAFYRRNNNIACFATASSTEGDDGTIPLDKLTVKDLKERLKAEGLSTTGLKADLIQRLSETTSVTTSPTTATDATVDATAVVSEKASSFDKPKKKKTSTKMKFKVNPNWRTEFNPDALSAEFMKLAKKDGFDESTSYYAKDATFEDDFDDGDFEGKFALDDDDDDFMDDDDIDFDADDNEDDDIPDFGTPGASTQQSMEERIAEAKKDQQRGRVSVPKSLDNYSKDVSFDDLKKLGFRREVNPFGNDETPRRAQFKVISGAMACSGCGSNFQQDDELRPGFLPFEKYEIQTKLAKIEEAQTLQDKAERADAEWSTDDEIEYLLHQQDPKSEDSEDSLMDLSADEMAERMGLDLELLSRKKVLCKRCHGLQNFGTVEQKLRPGWTDEPTLSQEQFRKLLLPLKQKTAVILALVDLFDFSGSVLPELDEIAGDNPVILAANKADLLPSQMGQNRAENWVRRELEYMNVQSIANIGGAVRLVSCKTGFGVSAMMEKAQSLAEEMECDIYIVGAANAGKSTLVNHLLDENNPAKNTSFGGKKRAGNANKFKGSVTTSPLPGTTLKFIRIELGGGKSIYDTPGLLIPGSLTERLTPEELKIVVPKK